ncbi:MAG: hypothetical protein ACKVQW_06020 [Pyrinomonadaceae bacterium]
MTQVLIVVLIAASLWDGFTTIYGTLNILGSGGVAIVASLLFGALILSFLLNTQKVWKWESDFAGGLLKLFWFVAIAYDLYTAWDGNQAFIVGETKNEKQLIVLAGLTIMISGSPVILSILWEKMMD